MCEPVEVQLELGQCLSVPGPSYRVPVLKHEAGQHRGQQLLLHNHHPLLLRLNPFTFFEFFYPYILFLLVLFPPSPNYLVYSVHCTHHTLSSPFPTTWSTVYTPHPILPSPSSTATSSTRNWGRWMWSVRQQGSRSRSRGRSRGRSRSRSRDRDRGRGQGGGGCRRQGDQNGLW